MSPTPPNMTPKMRSPGARQSPVLAVLDIGTSKVCCVIAKLEPAGSDAHRRLSHRSRVLGIGHQRTRGLKGGVIVDMAETENAIRAAIDSAERMAGVTVDSVVLSITGGRLSSQHFMAEVGIGNRAITDRDVERAMSAATAQALVAGRSVVHALPTGFRLDGRAPVHEPRGMVADRLSVEMHIASTDTAAARNLMLAVERGHLEVEAVVATPYASGLSVLDEDEAEMGIVVLDMGCGTTSAAVFLNGRLQHVDAVAVGGRHVTMDLARGLSMRLEDAERLKCLAATCVDDPATMRDLITIPRLGDDDRASSEALARAQVTRIVRPRVEEILELLRDRLRNAGFGSILNRGAVLTGGASQLSGLQVLAQGTLSKQVRLGRPLTVKGMPESASSPAFAATTGLLIYPQMAGLEHIALRRNFGAEADPSSGYIARVGRWLRDSF